MPHAETQRPLAAHALFHTRDLDEARERVAAVFCPHRLDMVGRGGVLDARHHHLMGERISLNYIEYGAKTLIAPGCLERFYLLQIPLSGAAAIANGDARYVSRPGAAAVLNPQAPTTMIWEEGTRQLLVQIERKAMMDHLSAQLGHRAERALGFRGPLDLTTEAGRSLMRLVMYLTLEAEAGRSPIGAGLMGRQMESALMSGLLEAHRHDYEGLLGRSREAPRPRHLRLAESYIEARLDQALTLEEIAEAAGISARALQLAFRRHRGVSPLGFWRDLRLQRAHEDLAAGRAGVTEAALKWGFAHFGRFSKAYRERYGLSPRDSVRAARGPGYQD